MSRAKSARRKIADDIPLAQRSRPVQRASSREYGLLTFSLLLLFLFGAVLAVSFVPRFRGGLRFIGFAGIPSSDGRLLGHYPYPEALTKNLIAVFPGLEVHRDTYKALVAMRNAASADGINLVLLSGFRSIDLQRQIFYGRKSVRNQIAIERAKVSAPPGYSEHSTGYAIDLGDAGMRHTDFEEEFESTPAFKWLQKNAARYHFVLSFPKGNPHKISYEPWHWRYEGTVDALRQFEAINESRRNQEASI